MERGTGVTTYCCPLQKTKFSPVVPSSWANTPAPRPSHLMYGHHRRECNPCLRVDVRGDDPELASYLRVEERELEAGGRKSTPPHHPLTPACSQRRCRSLRLPPWTACGPSGPERLCPAASAPGGIGPPILRHLDGRPSTSVRERLVVEARDDVQVRVVRRLSRFREAVPNEHVTVRCEALVLCGFRLDEKFVRRLPLLRREVKRR